jgi:hypothetical protein
VTFRATFKLIYRLTLMALGVVLVLRLNKEGHGLTAILIWLVGLCYGQEEQ